MKPEASDDEYSLFEDGNGDGDREEDDSGNLSQSDSEDSEEDIEYMGTHDSTRHGGEGKTVRALFDSWPKGDERLSILNLLESSESTTMWTDWLKKYPAGDIDATDVLNHVLPHALLRKVLGDFFPTYPIHNGYRSLLTSIREAAINLFKPISSGTFQNNIGRLRSALRSLGTESPTYRAPACEVCARHDMPCLSADHSSRCLNCALHGNSLCNPTSAAAARARSRECYRRTVAKRRQGGHKGKDGGRSAGKRARRSGRKQEDQPEQRHAASTNFRKPQPRPRLTPDAPAQRLGSTTAVTTPNGGLPSQPNKQPPNKESDRDKFLQLLHTHMGKEGDDKHEEYSEFVFTCLADATNEHHHEAATELRRHVASTKQSAEENRKPPRQD